MRRVVRFRALRAPVGAFITGGVLLIVSATAFPTFSNARIGGASALVTRVTAGLGLTEAALRFVHRRLGVDPLRRIPRIHRYGFPLVD